MTYTCFPLTLLSKQKDCHTSWYEDNAIRYHWSKKSVFFSCMIAHTDAAKTSELEKTAINLRQIQSSEMYGIRSSKNRPIQLDLKHTHIFKLRKSTEKHTSETHIKIQRVKSCRWRCVHVAAVSGINSFVSDTGSYSVFSDWTTHVVHEPETVCECST